jgi:hypothetical protein
MIFSNNCLAFHPPLGLLVAQGYEVRGAEDGFEGLAALKQSLPDVDVGQT